MTFPEATPEDTLSILLTPGDVSPASRENAHALLRLPLNWDSILQFVRRHQTLPLFYRNLKSIGLSEIPPDVEASLKTAFKMNAIRNVTLVQELRTILTLFGDAGIPVIPLKGVAMAERFYGDTSLRVCNDVDILVPRNFVIRSLRLLFSNGYAGELKNEALVNVSLRSGIEHALTRNIGGRDHAVEVHWGVSFSSRLDDKAAEQLWNESGSFVFFGVPGRVLSPEWEFLFLALHAARHRWRLRWLADVHDACSLRQLDWDKVKQISKDYGWDNVVELSLSTCNYFFGTPVPVRFVQREVPRDVFPSKGRLPLETVYDAAFYFRLLKGWRARTRYMLRLFVPGIKDQEFLNLPPAMWPLHCIIRPIRLTVKYSFISLRSLAKSVLSS
jgi:hypothetical protein